jgi:hypothetical protein
MDQPEATVLGKPLIGDHDICQPLGAVVRSGTARRQRRGMSGCSCPGDCEGGPECLDDEGGPPAPGLEDPDGRPPIVSAPTGDLATDWAFGL